MLTVPCFCSFWAAAISFIGFLKPWLHSTFLNDHVSRAISSLHLPLIAPFTVLIFQRNRDHQRAGHMTKVTDLPIVTTLGIGRTWISCQDCPTLKFWDLAMWLYHWETNQWEFAKQWQLQNNYLQDFTESWKDEKAGFFTLSMIEVSGTGRNLVIYPLLCLMDSNS